ncbi:MULTISPECIES: C40 family peptidase [Leclercia]|uniref:C40 family peptidase n=1 Tax=Leclercia pneumoniae TaxID=2815358 RepID=A0ABX8JR53_9ENTR|nr:MULTISPECIES: C40 family peptidase [Leclercia]MBM6605380.1 C40 family peptidase [Enterobacteriaceae bacterium RIT 814]MCV2510507.1 C40 family peptidase [Leclercia pneumoniae]QSW37221.1 C40 family peptidase [Leclercia pneumoniae]QWW77864.1 C40 family peptidase [Leclercia pneumoniae]WNN82976.1 C40 family peptidase [Leclercia pneumoniae]
MARINKISITLCALLFTTLTFTSTATASEQARTSAVQKKHLVKVTEPKKKSSSKKTTKKESSKKSSSKKNLAKTQTASSSKKSKTSSRTAPKTASRVVTEKCTVRKGHKTRCVKTSKPTTLAEAHKVRMQKAQKTAMNKLMGQIGKPYRWGGNSPRTGFDCSGLVWYAYKDLVKFRIPRTANEMYHLRDASPVNRGELESGDLVFFRTQGRGTADHVGVYVGNGKFIQSPRTGQDIQITSLSEDYWQRHYVGARRVMTPKTIR